MSMQSRQIAAADVLRPIPVEDRVDKSDDTPLEESITITEFRGDDGELVRVEIDHYDGYRAIEMSFDQWRTFRAAIIERGEV